MRTAATIERTDIGRINERIGDVLDRFRAILRLAELEAGQRRAGFKQVDPARLVESVAQLYAPLAEEAGVRLLPITEGGSHAEADPDLLFEALSNLVDNAIEFSPRG